MHGHRRRVGQPLGHAAQQRAAAGQVDALEDDVLGQLGRRLAEAVGGRLMTCVTLSSRAPRTSSGREDDRLGPARGDLAPPDLGLLLTLVRVGRPDRHLDRFGRALADGHAVPVAHVALDGGVEVEAAAANARPPPPRRAR